MCRVFKHDSLKPRERSNRLNLMLLSQHWQQWGHSPDLRMNAYGSQLQQEWYGLPGYSQLQKPTKKKKKKGGVGLRITLKINEQAAVSAIETCWLQSATDCLGEITGPRTAEHLNKRQQNVFYEDINMALNYRVRPEADCTPLPKLCIISLYKRTSKPYLLILKK